MAPNSNTIQKVAIIGAGLAGCAMAYELSQYPHFDTTIFDKSTQIAAASSGNYAGILAPYLTSDNNYSDQFHTLGYQLLLSFINKYKNKIEICNQGVLQLLNDDKDLSRYQKIFTKRNISSELARLISKDEILNFIDYGNISEAVYYPNAVSLVPKSICQLWLELSKARLKLESEIVAITKNENNLWNIEFNNYSNNFDIVVFAGGYELFKQLSCLQKIPVYPSQGQLTVIQKYFDIDITLMDKGYIIPNYNGNLQVVGATFRDNADISGEIRNTDNEFNLSQVEKMLPTGDNDYKIVESRVATRCVTSDHLPLVGKLVNYNEFEASFYKPLSKGYPKSKMPKVNYQKGLYLASGFGSKGLCSSMLAAKIIVSQITSQNQPCSDKLLQALSIERFWLREFKKGNCF